MSRVLGVVCLIWLVLCTSAGSAGIGEWMPVGAHYHSNFSDGVSSIEDATAYMISSGNRYALLSDHAEMINKTASMSHQSQKMSGYGSWLATAMSVDGCVPGLECGLGPSHGSHLLYYGGLMSAITVASVTAQSGESSPPEALETIEKCARESGAALIAAHPTCAAYPFKMLDADIDGVEIFDSFGKDAATDLYFLKKLKVARIKPMAVVTGSDYHGPNVSRLNAIGKYLADTGNFSATMHAPWNLRRTYVNCASKHQIAEAIRSRRCYAAFADARITSASVCPGDVIEATEQIVIDYTGVPFGPGVGNVIFAVGKNGTDHQQNAVTDHFDGTLRFDPTSLPAPVLKDGCYLYFLIGKVIGTSAIEVLPYDKPKKQKEPSTFDQVASALVGGLIAGLVQGSDRFDLTVGPEGASLVPVPPSLQGTPPNSNSNQRNFVGELLNGSLPGGAGAGDSSRGTGIKANTAAASGGSGSVGSVSPFFVAPTSGGGGGGGQPAPSCAPVTVSGRGANREDGVSFELVFNRLADTRGTVSMVLTGADGRTIRFQDTRPFGGTAYTAAGFPTSYGWRYDADMGRVATTRGVASVILLTVSGSIKERETAARGAIVYYNLNGDRKQVSCKF
ncbi:MAG: hypothetical protein BWY43_00811 [candidate division WS2 bacterium ADurb.Bin280]|uniref:PHP domain protein n=1 Tax=candidate division WS2 bacterium ADurb.Bin280 TaxID=1852829 RepID=A0A1V5SC15_9BACT|nr:MAG: hypothetical protein BWY43_00811 [candidate division WS2 bacterium ADurb.Bin280]